MSKQKSARKRAGKNPGLRSLRERQRQIARQMVRDVGEVADPFEAERWASWVHGQIWEQRHKAPPTRHLDWALVLGAQIADDIADVGTPDALACLRGLAWADQGPFGALCEKLISDLSHIEMPAWAAEIGETTVARAAVDEHPGEGAVLIFDIRRPEAPPHTLSVLVSDTRGGIAKHLALMECFERLPVVGGRLARGDQAFWFRPTEPRAACERVRRAIELTDALEAAPVDERYATYRAMTLARVAPYLLEAPGAKRLAG